MYPGGTYGNGLGGLDLGFRNGGSYQMYGSGPIVAGGKIVYSIISYGDADVLTNILVCVDEVTGKTLWTVPMKSAANLYFINHFGQYAGGLMIAAFSGTTLDMVDSETGIIIAHWDWNKLVGWPGSLSGPQIEFAQNILYTKMNAQVYATLYGSYQNNSREGYVYAFSMTNPKLTADGSGLTKLWGPVPGDNTYPLWGDVIVLWYPSKGVMGGVNKTSGQLLWEIAGQGFCRGASGYGNFYHFAGDGRIWCIDLVTGDIKWKSQLTAGTAYWTEHGLSVGNGVVIGLNYDGGIYCFDAFTGALKWVRYMGPTTAEPYYSWYGTTPYGGMPPAQSGDGVAYAVNGDHMKHDPDPAGQYLKAFNVTNGDVLFEYPADSKSHTYRLVVADGMLYLSDGNTNQLLAFGKGDTGTEVSVAKSQIAKGEYTWITGKVTDQSLAQKDTPAVARESMQAWMAYLHAGGAAPDKKTGVPVMLFAKNSAGNTIEIGSTITDGDTGIFTYKWAPPDADMYTITAVFSGDDSYWDSYGITTLAAGPATAASSTSSSTTSSSATASITIAALAAVVIGAIVIQKRPFKSIRKETEK